MNVLGFGQGVVTMYYSDFQTIFLWKTYQPFLVPSSLKIIHLVHNFISHSNNKPICPTLKESGYEKIRQVREGSDVPPASFNLFKSQHTCLSKIRPLSHWRFRVSSNLCQKIQVFTFEKEECLCVQYKAQRGRFHGVTWRQWLPRLTDVSSFRCILPFSHVVTSDMA